MEVYTVKPSNIKVNLGFALGNTFRLKTVFSQKDIWLVLAIIYMVVDLFTGAIKQVNETSSIVLLAVYRLQNGNFERILDYVKKIKPSDSSIEINKESCMQALDNLENLKCIELVDGEYRLRESIDSSLYSYNE